MDVDLAKMVKDLVSVLFTLKKCILFIEVLKLRQVGYCGKMIRTESSAVLLKFDLSLHKINLSANEF